MTLVAVHAVVNVPANALMVLIGVRFGMTIRALEHRVIARIYVAGCANSARATMVGVEPGVVEDRSCPPGDDLVACLAGGGEAGRHVIGVVGGQILNLVTRIAVGRERCVVVVHVATGARYGRMCSHERERRVVMVEGRGLPRRCAVADVALLGKSSSHVIRIRRALVILQVATHAGGIRQVVIPVDVTIAALQFQVPSRQRETALGMIKCGGLPGRGAVAHRAVGGKARRYVIRIRRGLVLLQVATHAGGAGEVVVPVDVAIAAL